MESKYISVTEAAEIIGVDERTIKRMILNKTIRAIDVNGAGRVRHSWRVLKEDLMPSDNNSSGVEGGDK